MVQLTYTLAEAGADSEQQVFGKAERVHIHLLDQDKQLKHERLLFSLRPTSVTQDEHMRFRKGLFWLRLLFTPVHVYLSLLCLWIGCDRRGSLYSAYKRCHRPDPKAK